MNIDRLREEGVYDPVGTIRVSEQFGTIAIYIKVDENCWRTVYVDPVRNQHLIPNRNVSDSIPSWYPVAFTPKPVV